MKKKKRKTNPESNMPTRIKPGNGLHTRVVDEKKLKKWRKILNDWRKD